MKKSTRKIILLIAGFIVIILASISTLFYVQLQPPEVTQTPNRLTISNLYSFSISPQEITQVSLIDTLPEIQARTNGFSAFNVLRGHFKLEGLGEGMLFIHNDRPPFVLVQSAERYVIINDEDPTKTKQTYQDLLKRSPKRSTR